MQIGIENYYQIYSEQNKIFDPNAYSIGENLEYPFVLLKNKLKELNCSIDTLDIKPLEEYKKVIFLDYPHKKSNSFNKVNKDIDLYLILFESELIRPDNWVKENHKYFKKVFTLNDAWVDGKKYIKYYWPNKIPDNLEFDLSKKFKLCTLIAGYKFNSHPLELYSEREKAISWFEQNHPEEFDLYGIGWDKYHFKGKLKWLNRCKFLTTLFKNNYPSYKGQVISKSQTLQKYKFAICYENARDIPGYTTEKIFDCFFAGCVPIYWGAPNITSYIPENTFIDKRNFVSYEGLYTYIKNISQQEYIAYLENIKSFINSKEMNIFNADYFTQIIINEILELQI